MDLNSTTLVGRLAAPVLFTQGEGDKSSRAVGRIIVNRIPGQVKRDNDYDVVPFVCWGKLAEAVAKFTDKGKELGITGRLRTNSRPNPQAPTGWDNFFEVQAQTISFGRDSNTVKTMKAIEALGEPGTGDTPVTSAIGAGSVSAAATATLLRQIMDADPNIDFKAIAANLANAGQTPAVETPAAPAVPVGDDSPFLDKK